MVPWVVSILNSVCLEIMRPQIWQSAGCVELVTRWIRNPTAMTIAATRTIIDSRFPRTASPFVGFYSITPDFATEQRPGDKFLPRKLFSPLALLGTCAFVSLSFHRYFAMRAVFHDEVRVPSSWRRTPARESERESSMSPSRRQWVL